jgi:hypothetical protein
MTAKHTEKSLKHLVAEEDMEWEPYWFKLGRDGFIKEVKKRSGEMEEKLAKD